MSRIAFLSIIVAALLVPSQGWAEIRVLKADCAQYLNLPFLQQPYFVRPTDWTGLLAPLLQVDYKGNLVCSPAGPDPGGVSETVYSKGEIDGQMAVLKSGLQQTLEDTVFAAAVKSDQIDAIENEIWRRLGVKYRTEIQALDQQIGDLKAKLQALEAAAAAAASASTTPTP